MCCLIRRDISFKYIVICTCVVLAIRNRDFWNFLYRYWIASLYLFFIERYVSSNRINIETSLKYSTVCLEITVTAIHEAEKKKIRMFDRTSYDEKSLHRYFHEKSNIRYEERLQRLLFKNSFGSSHAKQTHRRE